MNARVSLYFTRLTELWVARGLDMIFILASILTLALTAWVGISWFWYFKAPESIQLITVSVVDPNIAAKKIVSHNLFYNDNNNSISQPSTQYTLLGVMTGTNSQPGFAILSQAGQPATAVLEKDEITSGLILTQVLANKVIVTRENQKETFEINLKSQESSGREPTSKESKEKAQPPLIKNSTETKMDVKPNKNPLSVQTLKP